MNRSKSVWTLLSRALTQSSFAKRVETKEPETGSLIDRCSGGEVAVFAQGECATLDYLLMPHLATRAITSAIVDTRERPERVCRSLPPAGGVLVRYLPRPWIERIRSLREHGGDVAYLMDDDLMDARAVAELPEPYRSRVRKQALDQRRMIEELCTEFWVSTPYLAQKYARWNPQVLRPRPCRRPVNGSPPVWVFYHGTASHQHELKWLFPLMRQVQATTTGVRLEVFGDHAVYKQFRELPQATVLHPMSWPNYLDYTSSVQRHIGLAPLLPGRFNAGRGPTKFFDFARMGAAGLYSDVEPYRSFVRHGVDGLLLPNDTAVWVRAITELAVDARTRKALADAARSRALDLAY